MPHFILSVDMQVQEFYFFKLWNFEYIFLKLNITIRFTLLPSNYPVYRQGTWYEFVQISRSLKTFKWLFFIEKFMHNLDYFNIEILKSGQKIFNLS